MNSSRGREELDVDLRASTSSAGPALPTCPITAPASIGSSSSTTSPGLPPSSTPRSWSIHSAGLSALRLVGEVHVQRVELHACDVPSVMSWRSSTKLIEPIGELAPMRAATRRPGNGANTGASALRGEVDAAVPQPRLAPRTDREEAAVGALLVRLVELVGVVLERRRSARGTRGRSSSLSSAALREHREAERAAQLAAEVLEVERARIPLLVRQVVVADVAGEPERRRSSAACPSSARPGSTAGTRRAGSAAGAAARAQSSRERVVLRLRVVEREDRVAVDLARLDVALRARACRSSSSSAPSSRRRGCRARRRSSRVPLRRVIGHQREIDRLVDRAVVVDQEVTRQAALVLQHGEAHVRADCSRRDGSTNCLITAFTASSGGFMP